MVDLRPFPPQPDGVPWPTQEWEEAAPPPEVVDAGLPDLLDALTGPGAAPEVGHPDALAIVHRGRIVVERYGERAMGPLAELAGVVPGPLGPTDPLCSWSMAKSILHLAVGVARAQGRLDERAPAPVPAWQGPEDPRRAITWDHLLAMRPGLQWFEEYVEAEGGPLPDVITMLYGEPAADMAAFAASFPLIHTPGSSEAYYYSSGTSNIVARALQDVLGRDGEDMAAWLREVIFAPIGATTPTFGLDARGTWVASSHVDMVARDWLRLGLLALRGGTWDGREVVPAAWIDHGRTLRSMDVDGKWYGAHWWGRPVRDDGLFAAHGFEGQRLVMVPDRDLVLFRHGKTAEADMVALDDLLLAVVDLFPRL